MRKLSNDFICDLQSGLLMGLLKKVNNDSDLDLEIRENNLNIYYKGNSLLKLDEVGIHKYRPDVHPKFLQETVLPIFDSEKAVDQFLFLIPKIKENIILHGKSSIETEYEQLIIRANNDEVRNNSEYFIVDRQYVAGKTGRFDLTGFNWPREGRRRNQEVPICLIEIKYALNHDIQKLDQQVKRYHDAIAEQSESFSREVEIIFRQKLDLGLFHLPADRLDAMKSLTFKRDIQDYQFIIFLVDYNPYSKHLDLQKLRDLPFANQIKVYQSGFALWKPNLMGLKD